MNDIPHQVLIESLAVGGAGVGRVLQGPIGSLGKRAFVPFSVPGELLSLESVLDKKSFIEASIAEVIKASPDRVKPKCPVFMQCGGCDLQHISIQAQRRLKCEVVESTLKHLAAVTAQRGVALIGANLPAERYRRRAVFHVDQLSNIGFFRRKSGDVVDMNDCLIVDQRIDWARSVVRESFKRELDGIASVIVECLESEVIVLLSARTQASRRSIRSACKNTSLPVGLRAFETEDAQNEQALVGRFSQVNAAANNLLIEAVSDLVGNISAKSVTELFAGSGNLTHSLCAKGCNQLDAVEVDTQLATRLDENLKHFAFLRVHRMSVEKFLRREVIGEIVVLDPPRAGAAKVFEALSPLRTERVVYVSCNVATLARDIKIGCQKGYQLIETRVLDMFPQTQHIETISLLERC